MTILLSTAREAVRTNHGTRKRKTGERFSIMWFVATIRNLFTASQRVGIDSSLQRLERVACCRSLTMLKGGNERESGGREFFPKR